tara:strand:- start:669 stop:941 length:273 start_codon:yes stop_codon:yes gene_type:complete
MYSIKVYSSISSPAMGFSVDVDNAVASACVTCEADTLNVPLVTAFCYSSLKALSPFYGSKSIRISYSSGIRNLLVLLLTKSLVISFGSEV